VLKRFLKDNSYSWTTKKSIVTLGHLQHDKINNHTFTNTDGWGNKLVTIFARHLDSFILTNNFAIIFKIRDFGSRQILPLEQLYLSPGFAKIAPYPPCTVTAFWLKYRDRDRMLRRVTFTPSTAGPL
jgi:hypothetical protein